MLKPRLPLNLTAIRSYATRIAEKPPARFPDPLANATNATVKVLPEDNLTFYHRPPPSAPTPFSTTLEPSSPLLKRASRTKRIPMPPLLRPSAYRPDPVRMSDENVQKIRELRLSDPEAYSRTRLAKMFKCTPNFVSKVAALPRPQRKQFSKKIETEHEEIRAGWGEKKSTYTAIRQKRREFW